MVRSPLFDEFHIGLHVPRELGETECVAIRRALDSRRFQLRLERAIRAVVRQYRSLGKVRVTLSR